MTLHPKVIKFDEMVIDPDTGDTSLYFCGELLHTKNAVSYTNRYRPTEKRSVVVSGIAGETTLTALKVSSINTAPLLADAQPSAESSLPENDTAKQQAQEAFGREVRDLLADLGDLLVEKNRKYGDAALNPSPVFSRQSATEQIKVRLDDKLKRLANQQPDEDEDVELDLMGYLVLLRIAKKRAKARGG